MSSANENAPTVAGRGGSGLTAGELEKAVAPDFSMGDLLATATVEEEAAMFDAGTALLRALAEDDRG
ncbi:MULTISPECIES: hypothetical protein [unclassified Thiocapsa]|uniref:hypothetical protein n=1 Tax=unclassified Thiocapsa TaxID=2641286 RepID=UPI0035B3FB9D